MAFDIDKYTSWRDPWMDVILDLDPYMSTSWIGSLYRHCEHEVPMTICIIENEIWMNLLHVYTLNSGNQWLLIIIVLEVTIHVYGSCHNGFPPRLGGLPKIKWSRHQSFLYGCDRSSGTHVSKLETEIPYLKQHNWSMTKVGDSKLGSTITREEGLAPSRLPFENGTN